MLPPHLTSKKILLVDDNEPMLDIAGAFLRGAGLVNITISQDGMDALNKLRSQEFDLIICDWMMPKMSGLQVLQTMRKDEKLKHIDFLMVTAAADKDNVKQAISAGINGFIVKPFSAETMISRVQELLDKDTQEAINKFRRAAQ